MKGRDERRLTDEEGGLVGERKGKKREWLKGGLQLPNGAGGCSPKEKRKRCLFRAFRFFFIFRFPVF